MKRYLIMTILAALVASLFCGAAFAEEEVGLTHQTIGSLTEEGKGDLESAAFNAVWPYTRIYQGGLADNAKIGTITIDLVEPGSAKFSRNVAGKREELVEEWPKGKKTLALWYRIERGVYVGHPDNAAYEFLLSSEKSFAGAEFEVDATSSGRGKVAGRFPVHITTEKQKKSKPVPYLELIPDATGANCIGLRWKFVKYDDPTRTALVKTEDGSDNDIRIYSLGLWAWTSTGSAEDSTDEDSVIGMEVGKPMEGVWNFDAPVAAKSIYRFEISFVRPHSDGENSDASYYWVWQWQGIANTDGRPKVPSQQAVDAAETAAKKDLKGLKAPDNVHASAGSYITTQQNVWYHFDSTITANTSAVVALSQDVENYGDAVVFAASGDMTLPLNETSITGADLPPVTSMEDLLASYQVWKTFDDGTRADLLDLYGTKLFEPANDGITIDATIVVIDNDVTDITDPKVKKFGASGQYGIWLNDADPNNKFLYVWDGNKNGVVNDPISLEAGSKENKRESKSSSGSCATGAVAMVATAALALIRRKG